MFDTTKLYSLLLQILGPGRRYSNNEYYFYCPFCAHHNPKLAINFNTGKWHCWKCNSAGRRIIYLLKRLEVNPALATQVADVFKEEIRYNNPTDVTKAELKLPAEYRPLWNFNDTYKYKHALAYLRDRNITGDDIFKYKIGYCETGKYEDRIIVPSYDANFQLNYFVGRAFYEMSMPYLTPSVKKNIIGFESLIEWSQPIVLVEGVFDAIAVKRNAIPLFGKQLPKKLFSTLIERNVENVYVALDSDAKSDIMKISQLLQKNNINVGVVHLTDKDPSNTGFEKMTRLIKDTSFITLHDLLEMKLSS